MTNVNNYLLVSEIWQIPHIAHIYWIMVWAISSNQWIESEITLCIWSSSWYTAARLKHVICYDLIECCLQKMISSKLKPLDNNWIVKQCRIKMWLRLSPLSSVDHSQRNVSLEVVTCWCALTSPSRWQCCSFQNGRISAVSCILLDTSLRVAILLMVPYHVWVKDRVLSFCPSPPPLLTICNK